MPLPECLRPRSPDLGGIVLLALGYAAFVLFGLEWAVVPGAGTSVWPAAGLALGVLMLAGPRLWPGVLLGRLLAAVIVDSPQPMWADFLIAAGTTVGGAVPALLRYPLPEPRLGGLRDIIWLGLGGAALGATISAGVGVLALAVNATAPSQLLSAGVNWMRTVDDLLTRAAPRNAA